MGRVQLHQCWVLGGINFWPYFTLALATGLYEHMGNLLIL